MRFIFTRIDTENWSRPFTCSVYVDKENKYQGSLGSYSNLGRNGIGRGQKKDLNAQIKEKKMTEREKSSKWMENALGWEIDHHYSIFHFLFAVPTCDPPVKYEDILCILNDNNDFSAFVRALRRRFQEYASN